MRPTKDPLFFKKINLKIGINYFLTSLTNRFDLVNGSFKKSLEDKFGGTFEPIFIYQNLPASHYEKENYIVVNKKANSNSIVGQENEDLNIELSYSNKFSELLQNLEKNQERIFMVGFTNAFLDLNCSKVIHVGPNPKVATYFDNKLNQYNLFLKVCPDLNPHRFYDSLEEAKLKERLPFYVSSLYSSGGLESGLVDSWEDLEKFMMGWRDHKKDGFIVSDYIQNGDFFPNTTAIVFKDKVVHLSLTEQILFENAYVGNYYPTSLSEEIKAEIVKQTIAVGNILRKEGYLGMFGCDFIIKNGKIYLHDLNPRHQGGYLMNHLITSGNSLAQAEISASLEEDFEEERLANIKENNAWLHSKIKLPGHQIYKVKNEVFINSEEKVFEFGEFFTSFYPTDKTIEDTYPGYMILAGTSAPKLIAKYSKKYREIQEKIVE